MRRTASEMLRELEDRIIRLERTAARREPRRSGPRNLADMNEDAQDLLDIAKKSGYRGAKIQFQGDYPVLVLDRGFYVFFDEKGYTIENPQGGEFFTYKFGDIVTRIQGSAGSDFGSATDSMEQMELTPTFDDINLMLTEEGGYLGELWKRVKNDTFIGGDYTMTVKLTRQGIKFSLTGPYLKRGEPISEVRGMVNGADRMEQLEGLAERLDAIAMQAGVRRVKDRARTLRLYKKYTIFG